MGILPVLFIFARGLLFLVPIELERRLVEYPEVKTSLSGDGNIRYSLPDR
jgi:hypothetical protein